MIEISPTIPSEDEIPYIIRHHVEGILASYNEPVNDEFDFSNDPESEDIHEFTSILTDPIPLDDEKYALLDQVKMTNGRYMPATSGEIVIWDVQGKDAEQYCAPSMLALITEGNGNQAPAIYDSKNTKITDHEQLLALLGQIILIAQAASCEFKNDRNPIIPLPTKTDPGVNINKLVKYYPDDINGANLN